MKFAKKSIPQRMGKVKGAVLETLMYFSIGPYMGLIYAAAMLSWAKYVWGHPISVVSLMLVWAVVALPIVIRAGLGVRQMLRRERRGVIGAEEIRRMYIGW